MDDIELGQSYVFKGEYDKAIEAYSRAIKLNPGRATLWGSGGRCPPVPKNMTFKKGGDLE